MHIELSFPVRGTTIPTDHAYLLYSALSRVVREFHNLGGNLRFSPINGDRGEKGSVRIFEGSRLRIRLLADQISLALPLTSRTLSIGAHSIELRPPTITPIAPATMLRAKVVTFKNALDPTVFLETAHSKLDAMDIHAEPGIPLVQSGEREGEPRRQIVRIKGAKIVGYPLQIVGLTAEESLRLQEEGLGGRTRIGCGFFVPI